MTSRRATQPWRADEDEWLLHAFSLNHTPTQLAARLQRTPSGVLSRLMRQGKLSRDKSRYYHTGTSALYFQAPWGSRSNP